MDPLSTTNSAAQALHAAQASDFSILALIGQASVFVQLVMLLLITGSVVTFTILFSKYAMMSRLKAKADRFEAALRTSRGAEDFYKAIRNDDMHHPMGAVFAVGLREWERSVDKDGDFHGVLIEGVAGRVQQMMMARAGQELEKLEGGVPVLATVGSTAPFVGLLGTVWGIMSSFQNIGASKNTSLAVVAPGIAEALLATAFGLFAAIPAVVAYNKISTDLGRYGSRLENFIVEFCAMLERQEHESKVAARKANNQRRSEDVVRPLR